MKAKAFIVLAGLLVVTAGSAACSCRNEQPDAEKEAFINRIESVTVNYEDGNALSIESDTPEWDQLVDELSEIILSADGFTSVGVYLERYEQTWKYENTSIEIRFDGPVVIVFSDILFEGDKLDFFSTTPEGYYATITSRIIVPLDRSHLACIWIAEAANNYWESGLMNIDYDFDGFVSFVNGLRE
jgi:hypothetical protein